MENEQPRVKITIEVERPGLQYPYNKITHCSSSIEAATQFYFMEMNKWNEQFIGPNYLDFPLFKNEVQEIDYQNIHTDNVADLLLKKLRDPKDKGVFGSDKLNEIIEMYRKANREKNELVIIIVVILAFHLITLFCLKQILCF